MAQEACSNLPTREKAGLKGWIPDKKKAAGTLILDGGALDEEVNRLEEVFASLMEESRRFRREDRERTARFEAQLLRMQEQAEKDRQKADKNRQRSD